VTQFPTIAVDARRNTWAPQYGISRYARNLLRAIFSAAPEDLRVRPVDLEGSLLWSDAEPILVQPGHSLSNRIRQEQVDLPRRADEFDLLHLPWYEGPVWPRRPHVVAVHDLDTLEHPQHYRRRFRAYYNSLLRIYAHSAARLIAPSHATKEAITHRWPRARCTVIPLGVDPIFSPNGDRYPVRDPGARVIAYTGGYNGRKRLGDLLRAFEAVAQERGDVTLVMTGSPPPDAQFEVERSPAASRIEITGYLPDAELAAVYRAADVIVYPSTVEGFGFPVVEAFGSGTPVIATATGSIPEVAGDAALLVALGDVNSLAEGIARVLDDSGVASNLQSAGLQRAERYGWRRTAELTLDCWREVLG
jgi:glycosyltransferase involved in cell wall biosynthesis